MDENKISAEVTNNIKEVTTETAEDSNETKVNVDEVKPLVEITNEEKQSIIKQIEEDILKEVSCKFSNRGCKLKKKHCKILALLLAAIIGFGVGFVAGHGGHLDREGDYQGFQRGWLNVHQKHMVMNDGMGNMVIQVVPQDPNQQTQ